MYERTDEAIAKIGNAELTQVYEAARANALEADDVIPVMYVKTWQKAEVTIGHNFENGMPSLVWNFDTKVWCSRDSFSGRETPQTFEECLSDAGIMFTG